MMKPSSTCVQLIKRLEGCKLIAYQDERGIWTIGYGHTGPEVHAGYTCTQDTAELWLQQDLERTALGVIKSLDVQLGQNAFDAIVSFSYNVGLGNEAHSTLLKLVNQRYTGAASAEFLKWVHETIGGVVTVSNGLVARRTWEKYLFLATDGQPVVFPAIGAHASWRWPEGPQPAQAQP